MSDEPDKTSPQHLPLTVLPNSGKVDQLRKEMAADGSKNLNQTSIVDRALDQSRTPAQKAIAEKVIEALRTVYDPEIPVNIYDLGLIYDIDVDAEASAVYVQMTLTAPGCPVAGTLPGEVQKKIESVAGVKQAVVELVWDPPWTKERMSEIAMLELGLM